MWRHNKTRISPPPTRRRPAVEDDGRGAPSVNAAACVVGGLPIRGPAPLLAALNGRQAKAHLGGCASGPCGSWIRADSRHTAGAARQEPICDPEAPRPERPLRLQLPARMAVRSRDGRDLVEVWAHRPLSCTANGLSHHRPSRITAAGRSITRPRRRSQYLLDVLSGWVGARISDQDWKTQRRQRTSFSFARICRRDSMYFR